MHVFINKKISWMSLPAQDLAHTAVADPQLPGDVTGSDTLVGQLYYPLPHHIR